MEWAKIGATVVTQVVSMNYKRTDQELNEVKRERDVYKKEAECLKSHLRDVKRYSRGQPYKSNTYNSQKHIQQPYKSNTYNSQRNFNSKYPPTEKKGMTAGSQKQFAEKKSYGNSGSSGGFSQNNNSHNTQQSSSWFFGIWSSSSPSSGKTNSSGSSKTSGSSGRGNYSHSRGRGGGRGNGRGRGSFRQ